MGELNTFVDIQTPNGPITLLLIALILLLRAFSVRLVTRNERLVAEGRRRWLLNIRNALLAVFLVGLVVIWAPQLRTLAGEQTAWSVLMALAMKLVTAA